MNTARCYVKRDKCPCQEEAPVKVQLAVAAVLLASFDSGPPQ